MSKCLGEFSFGKRLRKFLAGSAGFQFGESTGDDERDIRPILLNSFGKLPPLIFGIAWSVSSELALGDSPIAQQNYPPMSALPEPD